MIKRGEKPTRIFNDCSGKHAGFLTVARHWDIATKGYELHDHPVQLAIVKTLAELTGIDSEFPWGVDGCTAPNFAVPLAAQARALAQLSGARGQRIVRAMTANPELVSGTGRTCAILMRSCQGRAAVKIGAEGFFTAIVPELGLGIAIKIDDGAGRAADTAMAAMLEKYGLLGDDEAARNILRAPITNTVGTVIGERRAVQVLQ
jgi:L-asparaginase II